MGILSPPKTLSSQPRRRSLGFIFSVSLSAVIFTYLVYSLSPCLIGANCYRGYYSKFSFDAGDEAHARWMGEIPDGVALSALSVPGTHDTMTYQIGDDTLECQNWNLSMQLNSGLRYFDIRARLRDDELHIYHGNGYTGFSFTDVLLPMFAFLDENPSEAIIMRLKEEGPPIGQNNTITFEEAFNRARLESPATAAGAKKHLSLYDRVTPLPTIGELRSKIFLLEQFKAKGGPYGLEWEGKQMALEDKWIIPDIYHLSEKWTAIREALELAATSPVDNSVLYLAHISASVGVVPIEAAAGPYHRRISGMNDMTGQWIEDFEDNEDTVRTGVVIIDYPGRRFINAILRWNYPLIHAGRQS